MFIHPFVHSLVLLYTCSSIHPFVHSLVLLFTRSSVSSLASGTEVADAKPMPAIGTNAASGAAILAVAINFIAALRGHRRMRNA